MQEKTRVPEDKQLCTSKDINEIDERNGTFVDWNSEAPLIEARFMTAGDFQREK